MDELPDTLIAAVTLFADEQHCFDLLKSVRWPDTIRCPRCGSVLEKGGDVRTMVVLDRSGATLQTEIKKNVAVGSKLYTDELGSYKRLRHWYSHHAVCHEDGGYIDGRATTNDLEGYWSILKRCTRGTYIAPDPHHLHRYLSETEFRYNTRLLKDGERFIEAPGS